MIPPAHTRSIPWHRRFQSLMAYRVREILLVSSAYDAFVLEEDGSLADRLFLSYSELSLSWWPRITHAQDAKQAMEMLRTRRFDLVITVVRIADSDAGNLSRMVKEHDPDMPVTLLIFDEADLNVFGNEQVPSTIDHVMQWTGTAGVLIATIKLVEDERNAEADTREGVQVIVCVEDRVRSYSTFLGILYPELLQQSQSLIAEGLNDFHRLMRMRARPKVVLATTYEEGLRLTQKFRNNLCALLTDIRIPRDGVSDPRGGLDLARRIRAEHEDLPILFQSAEVDRAVEAVDLEAWFVDKNAHNFQTQVRRFLEEALGFGDFVFRLPDRTEVGRARDTFEMEQALRTVPAESVAYHAMRNHFSIWLTARSMFELAARIRPRSVEEFDNVEQLRDHLVEVLQQARINEQDGVITDFSPRYTGPQNRFVRIGRGSVGGKGRAIAFVSALIARYGLLTHHEGLEIRIPKTVVIGTDVFDEFMHGIDRADLMRLSDEDIRARLLVVPLPDHLLGPLYGAFEALKGPLAVRSSSLLEDSRFQPFAGVYATFMLPNNHPDARVRFDDMCRAIKAVYASTFTQEARNYLAGTPHEMDEQKMAVVIQQVVGRPYGDRYYPLLSGVAQSYNYYPIGHQKPEDGVAHIALGLGHQVVSGGVALRFSPGAPAVLPQFPSARAVLEGTQTRFLAVDLSRPRVDLLPGPGSLLSEHDLDAAEQDGTLQLVASVYHAADDVIRDNLALPGPRVVTFNNILKWNEIPLAEALSSLLPLLRERVGQDVEIEMALDAPLATPDHDGSAHETHPPRTTKPRLYVLQLRPMSAPDLLTLDLDLEAFADDITLCRSHSSLGHGTYRELCDIVYVDADRLDPATTREITAQVKAINTRLAAAGKGYVLIGPGRWGSSDPTLGIGVRWVDIDHARIIVETPIGEHAVDPSYGTHFFRNITARHVGYVTVGPAGDRLHRAALRSLPGVDEGEHVRHITLPEPLVAHLDGRRGCAVVLQPAPLGR